MYDNFEEYKMSMRQALYDIYEHIFLLAYDRGLDLDKTIQDVSMEINNLKKENDFECEPEGYCGLWMVQSMADKLNVPVSQLFVTDNKLKNRVIEDILSEAINEKDNIEINFIEEDNDEVTVKIEFSIKRRNSYCTRKDVDMYCAELMKLKVTNEVPNNDRMFSEYLIRFDKVNGVYSICLSGKSDSILDTSYIYEMIEIYTEEQGRLQEFVEECIDIELKNISEDNKKNTISRSASDLKFTRQLIQNDAPVEVNGREFSKTEFDNRRNIELIATVYDTTRTMDILNEFEGLEGNGKPYERLVISNGDRVDGSSRYWLHYVIERSQNRDYIGDITFTNFKLGYVGDLRNHIKEELLLVNIEDYVDRDIFIKFNKPFHLRAQNKRNRTGYGWEWDWSGGYGDYTEGTLYGETTDYIFSGIYISSSYLYEQNKRKKMPIEEHFNNEIEDKQVNYYKFVVDGYVKGEYTLIVSSGSPTFKSKNKRIQLFIKAQRAGKDKYVPVACDIIDKLLYMNKETFDYYREQINRQHPLIVHKTYVE